METTLRFDPDVDDYDSLVAIIRSAYNLPSLDHDTDEGADVRAPWDAEPETSKPNNVEPTDGPWNVKRAMRYLRQLQPTALAAVAIVAAYGSVHQNRVAEYLDVELLRGYMSSLGYAARNTRGVPAGARPFYRQGSYYVMSDARREVFVAAFLQAGQPITEVLHAATEAAGWNGQYARRLVELHDRRTG